MDIASIIGLTLGLGGVLGGALLEGLHMRAIWQPTALLIILGGTLGATFLSFPLSTIIKAAIDLRKVFFSVNLDMEKTIKEIVGYATKARKNGLISLEQDAKTIQDQFIKKGISMLVDGIDAQKLRETMEAELNAIEEHEKASAEVYESAGGYSPTIGIIGAVLGLIHVMQNLSDTTKLGSGIAVAFVATIYGLMVANIFCLPIATKLKFRLKQGMHVKEMVIEGLISIQNGENPHFIENKLKAFMGDEGNKHEKGKKG